MELIVKTQYGNKIAVIEVSKTDSKCYAYLKEDTEVKAIGKDLADVSKQLTSNYTKLLGERLKVL